MDHKKRFGKLREAYDSGRLEYPGKSIEYVSSLVKKGSKVLDLGCGTGLATRQLANKGLKVIGCDSDEKMIEVSKRYVEPRIEYHVANADNLPFEDGEFDMVTAFGAFHWFRDKKSVSEIRRILKKKGVLAVINKNDTGKFRKDYRGIVKEIVGELPPSVKRGYSPIKILSKAGFITSQKKVFRIGEQFTIDDALVLVQSTGTWNHVPLKLHNETLQKLKERFSKTANKGMVERPIDVVVVHGIR